MNEKYWMIPPCCDYPCLRILLWCWASVLSFSVVRLLFSVGTVLPGEGEDAFVSAVEQLREVLRERMEMYNLELRACESMLTKE